MIQIKRLAMHQRPINKAFLKLKMHPFLHAMKIHSILQLLLSISRVGGVAREDSEEEDGGCNSHAGAVLALARALS